MRKRIFTYEEQRAKKLALNKRYYEEHKEYFRNYNKHKALKKDFMHLRDVSLLTGFPIVELKSFVSLGIIPIWTIVSGQHCYSIEQVMCLIQARQHATLTYGSRTIFSLRKFTFFIKDHWVKGEYHVKHRRKRSRSSSIKNSVQSGN